MHPNIHKEKIRLLQQPLPSFPAINHHVFFSTYLSLLFLSLLFPSLSFFLSAKGPPLIVNITDNTTVYNGDTVVFICDAVGDPPPSIVWTIGKLKKIRYRDRLLDQTLKALFAPSVQEDVELPADRAQVINDTLIISPARPEDTGLVTCRAKNYKGYHDASVFLTVEGQ